MSINAIREVMIENDEISKNSIYVPADVCYSALEEAKELKLHPAQIMSIISWAECYDKTGTQLDFQRFADHAANVIVQLFDGDQLENRAFILEKPIHFAYLCCKSQSLPLYHLRLQAAER